MGDGAMQPSDRDSCLRLLVVDYLGLFVAPLDATECEAVEIAELLASTRYPVEGVLPLGSQALADALPAEGRDRLSPVHPVVLRQQGDVILAWDNSEAHYCPLGPAHLAVLDALRFPMEAEYLAQLVGEGDWSVDEADLFQAVAQLHECGLLALERVQVEPDPSQVWIEAEEFPFEEPRPEELQPEEIRPDEMHDEPHLEEPQPDVEQPDEDPTADDSEVHLLDSLPDLSEFVNSAPSSESPDPGLFEDLPSGAAAVRVIGYRTLVRSRRRGRRAVVKAGRATAQRLLDRFGVESDDWDPQPDDQTDSGRHEEPEHDFQPEPCDPELLTPAAELPESDALEPESEQTGPVSEQLETDLLAPEAVESDEHDEPALPEPALMEVTEVRDPRTPVFAVYHSPEHNASLGLGLIMAYARVVDRGVLNVDFDLRKARIDADPMLEELARTGRQAIVLFSDFMWSIDHNLAVSARVKELNPMSLTVHGGPHAPKYEGDAERFFADNPHVDILARGEGELTVAHMLRELGPNPDPTRLRERLEGVEGITFRDGTPESYQLVRTADRKRATDMNDFPSPYLTGEFDEIDPARWRSATIETNRGCPYGCTFCDWGSVTNSRIRQFDHDRVFAELEWLAARGISEVFLADANFGLFAHDVEVTQHIADLKEKYGAPSQIICSFAKNTVKNTAQIVRILVDAGICAEGSVALQTTDETTLANVERSNIKVEKYDALAEEFRRHRLPIVTDLLMGLPGATVESFKNDLQRCLDQEVTPRMMETVLLPNSPMNAPSYKERFQIQTDESNVLVSTISYTREDFDEMRRLRLLFRACEHYGLLRHLFRWLQVEHNIRALDLIHQIDHLIDSEPNKYPLMTWVGRYFDLITAPPGGWPPFYDEVVMLLRDLYGIERDSAMDTVLAVQEFLMPSHGREFPDRISLDHDYARWYHATSVGTDAAAPAPRLADMAPGELFADDPADICDTRLLRNGFSIRRGEACDNPFWVLNDWELVSELARPMATAVPLLTGS